MTAPLGHQQIRWAIVRYLQTRPLAKDSLPGAAQWCRIVLGVNPALPLVEEALQQLVADGVVSAHVLPDGVRIFSAGRLP